jgi:hypothetical protein
MRDNVLYGHVQSGWIDIVRVRSRLQADGHGLDQWRVVYIYSYGNKLCGDFGSIKRV